MVGRKAIGWNRGVVVDKSPTAPVSMLCWNLFTVCVMAVPNTVAEAKDAGVTELRTRQALHAYVQTLKKRVAGVEAKMGEAVGRNRGMDGIWLW